MAYAGGFRLTDFHDDRSILEAEARDFPETPTPLVYLADLDQQAGDLSRAARRSPRRSSATRARLARANLARLRALPPR